MIKGFEEYTYELTDIELLIVDQLIKGFNNKIGKDKAVTSTLICKAIRITAPRLRKLINYIRCTNQMPGLCSSKNGYFIANNLDEINEYIISLKQRIKSQVDVLNSIEKQTELYGGNGQISLFE